MPLQERIEMPIREGRILDAAGELLLRLGYRRVTVEDVANHSGVGKGTLYLHWKSKQELFASLLLREVGEVIRELVERMRVDPAEVLLHRMLRASFLAVMQRPLARALYTRDAETLGKLTASELLTERQQATDGLFAEYVELLRQHGLLRTDTDLATQMYALQAAGAGFYFMEPFLPPQAQLSLERKAAALAEIIRLAFEPPGEPDLTALKAVAPRAIELFELMRTGGQPDPTTSAREQP